MSGVHWKQEPGKALCLVADRETSPAEGGDWLTRQRHEVTCSTCVEWMHA